MPAEESITSLTPLPLEGSSAPPAQSAAEPHPAWLDDPAVKQALQRCADTAMQAIRSDYTLRVPREPQDRADGFSRWLTHQQERLAPDAEARLRQELPDNLGDLPQDILHSTFLEGVWPQAESLLLSYALRGLARAWVSRNLGDAIALGEPEWTDSLWKVPLKLDGKTIGLVALDRDGNILTERSSSRDELLDRVDG